MERFYASLKTLRPVQTVALVIALLVSGGATYAGYELSSQGPSNGLEEDQQLIPIGFGDLVRQVTTSGSLEFPNRETLTFGTAGKVDQLMVRDGQSVTAGQELARLDSATAAGLAQSVAQAQVDVIAAQKQAIQELSTPIIPVMERVIVMPLVGNIDSMRARDITRSLLAGIRKHRAKMVILDITGVAVVDSGVANHLNKTIQAARLKGARTIITGISDAVAETIVDLGIDWGDVETLSDLQTGLITALNSMGVKLVK